MQYNLYKGWTPGATNILNGDIVEIQVSFIVVPLKDNKFKMIVVLRSITLLDPYFSQVRISL
ncbi:hypothetical protein BYT27DRAFT_7079376 [Phlegmacium glaucopus]|nr:hypothetical protein BYT27DRAFT_7079376 [Phlegmacium glaucopus]